MKRLHGYHRGTLSNLKEVYYLVLIVQQLS